MPEGIVKWYNPSKGYGFIEPTSGDKDIFVHVSALEQAGIDDLPEGQKVSFQIESNRGKDAAGDIKLID